MAAGVFLASCDGSSDSSGSNTAADSASSSATPGAAAGCTDVAGLKSSVQTLTDIEPLQDGLNALEAAFDGTKAALDTAVASVTDELRPAVEQVEAAFAAVQSAVDGTTTDNLKRPGARDRRSASGQGSDTALTSLAATLSQECPA